MSSVATRYFYRIQICIHEKDQNHVGSATYLSEPHFPQCLYPGYQRPSDGYDRVVAYLDPARVEVFDHGTSGRSNFGRWRQRVAGLGSIFCPIFEFRRQSTKCRSRTGQNYRGLCACGLSTSLGTVAYCDRQQIEHRKSKAQPK